MNIDIDFRQLGGALMMATVLSYLVLDLGLRAARLLTPQRLLWLGLGGAMLTTGICAIHLLCMHSVRMPIPISYDGTVTLISWTVATLLATGALYFYSRHAETRAQLLRNSAIGSLLIGNSLAALHYMGTYALRMSPPPTFNIGLLLVSIAVAVIPAGGALMMVFQRNSAGQLVKSRWVIAAASLLMAAAIVGVHFIGILSTHIAPDARCSPENLLPGDWVGVPIAFGLMVVILAGLTLLLVDSQLVAEQRRLDIERKRIERVRRLTFCDPTTGLPNRTLFNSALLKQITLASDNAAADEGGSFGLVYVELKNATTIMAKLGAERYNRFLIDQVIPTIQPLLPGQNTIFRYSKGALMLLAREPHGRCPLAPEGGSMSAVACTAATCPQPHCLTDIVGRLEAVLPRFISTAVTAAGSKNSLKSSIRPFGPNTLPGLRADTADKSIFATMGLKSSVPSPLVPDMGPSAEVDAMIGLNWSIGHARYPEHGSSTQVLIQAAQSSRKNPTTVHIARADERAERLSGASTYATMSLA